MFLNRRPQSLFAAPLGAVLTAWSLAGCDATGPTETPPSPRPVQVQPAQPPTLLTERHFVGLLQVAESLDLAFRVAGEVKVLAVEAGDQVTAGALLAKLDPRDFEVQLEQARARREAASSVAQNAREQRDQFEALYAQDYLSDRSYTDAISAARQAEAELSAAESAEQAASLKLSYTHLYAPGSCRVMARMADPNETVAAGQPIVQLDCGARLRFAAQVAIGSVDAIALGQSVQVDLRASGQGLWDAVVEELVTPAPSAPPIYIARAGVIEPGANLRPGMTGRLLVQLPLRAAGEVVAVVPSGAVTQEGDSAYVFVVLPDDEGQPRLQRRRVEPGPLVDQGIVIRSGIEPKELVVSAGLAHLKDGMAVRVGPESGPLD
ncbi:MAG: efflux RND transporter periplasmic adaptor subunit [Pseudomonadota bacterium]|nr:efflux RND transporter periplasmic adaptor subunit [Pseudomonadota bacterium]